MLETALVAFTTFFATIGSADVAALFAALTVQNTARQRRAMALKGTLIATAILLLFALCGEAILRLFGISLPALRAAGGILLLLIAIDMVFARPSGGTTTSEETAEAAGKQDISYRPHQELTVARSRVQRERIRPGSARSAFQAAQQASRMSS